MPVTVRFQLTRNTAAKNLASLRRRLPEEIDRELERAGSKLFALVRQTVPRRSGVLSGSYRLSTGKGFALVGSELNRARFTEFGTGQGVQAGRQVSNAVASAAAGFERRLVRRIQRTV